MTKKRTLKPRKKKAKLSTKRAKLSTSVNKSKSLLKPPVMSDEFTNKRILAKQRKRDKELKASDNGLIFPIPSIYNELETELQKTTKQTDLYRKMRKLTPYLIKRLLYESANQDNSPKDRIKSTEVLLNKIMPNLSAESIQIDSNDIQNLVIVRSKSVTTNDSD